MKKASAVLAPALAPVLAFGLAAFGAAPAFAEEAEEAGKKGGRKTARVSAEKAAPEQAAKEGPVKQESVKKDPGPKTDFGGEVKLRVGTQTGPLTGEYPFIPVYPQSTGVQWGGGASVTHGFGGEEAPRISAGAFGYAFNNIDSQLTGSTAGHAALPGGWAEAGKLPGLEKLGVYGYSYHRLGGETPALWNVGGDFETAAVHPLGKEWGLRVKGGLRYAPEEVAFDPAMAYALGGVETGNFSLYAGALVPLYESSLIALEMEWKLAAKTTLSLEGLAEIREETGHRIYHDHARGALTHAFGNGLDAGASIVLAPHGVEEAVLKCSVADVPARGLTVTAEAGIVQNPATQATQPMLRMQGVYAF